MILNFAKLLIEKGITDNKEDIKKVFVYALPLADMYPLGEIPSITTDGKNIFIEELDKFNGDFKDIKTGESDNIFYDLFEGMIVFNSHIVDTANELCDGLCKIAVECNDGEITAELADEYIAYYKVFSKFRDVENKTNVFKKIKKAIVLPPIYIHEIYQRIIDMRMIEITVVTANAEFVKMHDTRKYEDYFFSIIPVIRGGVIDPIIVFDNYYLKDNPKMPESNDFDSFMDKKVIDNLVKHKIIKNSN
jgi:hypothetical protein